MTHPISATKHQRNKLAIIPHNPYIIHIIIVVVHIYDIILTRVFMRF